MNEVISKDYPDKSTGMWCGYCGEAMTYNVPRLGPNGGYVHFKTGNLSCGKATNETKSIYFEKSNLTKT